MPFALQLAAFVEAWYKQEQMEQVIAEDYVSLYQQAFKRFGAMALWNVRQLPNPLPEDAVAITLALRVEGNLQARMLAEQIERACRAAH